MKYFELEPEKNTFSEVVADLTHRCNMKCKNCYIPNRDVPDMDVDKLIECISKFPKKITMRLIGAEPTMRRDLPEIIERVKKKIISRCSEFSASYFGISLAFDPSVRAAGS